MQTCNSNLQQKSAPSIFTEMEKAILEGPMANMNLSSEDEDLEKSARMRVEGNALYKAGKLDKGMSVLCLLRFLFLFWESGSSYCLTFKLLPQECNAN